MPTKKTATNATATGLAEKRAPRDVDRPNTPAVTDSTSKGAYAHEYSAPNAKAPQVNRTRVEKGNNLKPKPRLWGVVAERLYCIERVIASVVAMVTLTLTGKKGATHNHRCQGSSGE